MRQRRFAAAAVLALAAGALWAAQPPVFEWGAGVGTVGSFSDHGVGPLFDSRDSLSAAVALSHPVGPGEMTYSIGAEFLYLPQELQAGSPRVDEFLLYPSAISIVWELEQARLVDPWLRAAAGRLDAREPTGLLLENPRAIHPAQLVDGVSVETRFQRFYFSAEAGFLGLLDKRVNRVLFTATDESELVDTSRYFAPPRGLAILRAEGEDLLRGQSVALFGIWQKDFRADSPRFDSWYAGAAVKGQILSWLRQASSLTAGIGVPSGGSPGVGLLLDSEIALKLPGTLLHEAWFSVLWASSQGGGLSAFPQLAGPSVSLGYDEPLVDIVKLELGADADLPVAPSGAFLSPALAVRVLLAPSGTVPADYSFSFAGPYVGTEIEVSLAYVPVSGFSVTAYLGGLITTQGLLPTLRLESGVRL